MVKKTFLISMLLAALFTGAALADDHPEHKGADADSDAKAKQEIVARMESSRSFLAAAEKVVSKGNNREAEELLRNARLMMKEGEFHYETGQYTYSVEDFAEVMQLSTHAMILASNEQDWEMRDLAIYEESFQTERRENERKESVIKRNMEEAAAFISTAERVLRRFPDEGAFRKLNEAQEALMVSRAALAEGSYDRSLTESVRSYQLATRSIKEAYKSHGVTFVSNSSSEPASAKE